METSLSIIKYWTPEDKVNKTNTRSNKYEFI